MTFKERFRLIQKADKLIQNQSTGNAERFARNLGITKATLYRLLKEMKECFNAPIVYCNQSYQYAENGKVEFGFKPLEGKDASNILGGRKDSIFSSFLKKIA